MQDEINPKPRKTAAERQRDCRDRKKSKGKYVNVFVPREVAKKIRGNPSLLVKRFVEFSVLMNRIEELEEELDRVTSHREVRKLRLRKRIENEFFWKLYEKTVEDLPEIYAREREELRARLAEAEAKSARIERRSSLLSAATEALFNKLVGESGQYLEVIRGIRSILLNPRLKNEKIALLAMDRIRQECKTIIEDGSANHEENKASIERIFSARLRGAE